MLKKKLKFCYVHDWLINVGGAEYVLQEFLKIKPAKVYTLIYKHDTLKFLQLKSITVEATFLNKIPKIESFYRNLLPFFPLVTKLKKIKGYDVIITSAHAISNWFCFENKSYVISYCHTPMRYIWTQIDNYYNYLPNYKKFFFKLFLNYLRKVDLKSSRRVNLFIVPSTSVMKRVKNIYNREAVVLSPPVYVKKIKFEPTQKDDYYIFVGRLDIPYKKVDILIKAFNHLKKKLLIIGDGFDRKTLENMAGENIKFLGWKSKEEVFYYMKRAKALILPSEEDFGIVAVESQACGTPVIAYGKGGVIDTVIPFQTGIFFEKQDVDSIINIIEKFEKLQREFNPALIRKNAEKFDVSIFREKFTSLIEKSL